MSLKTWIWLGLFVGSSVGSLLPALFGISIFSLGSSIAGAIGGLAGIWIGYTIGKNNS
jgi:hypothetical protein